MMPKGAVTEQILLSDVMLYLFAKEADKKGQCKVLMADIYKIMSDFKRDFEELDIPIVFEKIGNDTYSRRIEDAMYYLIPFDIQIVNPSFSVLLGKDAAARRLEKLNRRIPSSAKKKLDSMFERFDAALTKGK